MERVGGDGRCKPSCFFLRRIDVFLADLGLYARGSPQGPRLGTDALAKLGTPAGWWAGIDALAELGAGGLVDAGVAHVICMPFGSFSFSFPFCSCPFRFVPALSFFCVLFSRPFFFLPLLLSCPFLSLCVSSFFPCWTVVVKFGRLPEPPATGSSPSLLPTSLSAGGWCYRYTICF